MRVHQPGITPSQRTAAALLISAIQDAVQETDEAKALWDEKRAVRDQLIRESLVLITKAKMVHLTGLSRERIAQIEATPVERKA